jgi:hypothetical protein
VFWLNPTGLRIIPGQSSFLILPKTVSRISAVLSSFHPAGAFSALTPSAMSPTLLSPVPATVIEERQSGGEFNKFEFVLVVSGDDRLIQRMNELGADDRLVGKSGGSEGADKVQGGSFGMTLGNVETCATRGKSSDAKWRLDSKDVVEVLSAFTK